MVLFFTESLVNIELIYSLYFESSKQRIEFLNKYNQNIYIHVNILGFGVICGVKFGVIFAVDFKSILPIYNNTK
jgi:formylmethanofuran dehydrogenase subunit B